MGIDTPSELVPVHRSMALRSNQRLLKEGGGKPGGHWDGPQQKVGPGSESIQLAVRKIQRKLLSLVRVIFGSGVYCADGQRNPCLHSAGKGQWREVATPQNGVPWL